jgi:hypothetical protein
MLLDDIYDRFSYGLVIDYSQLAVPPLAAANAAQLNYWTQTKLI